MAIVIEDAAFSRAQYALVIERVRAAKGRPSHARFTCSNDTNERGYRHMTFEYDDIKTDGYYANAWEGKISGWNAWLRRQRRP